MVEKVDMQEGEHYCGIILESYIVLSSCLRNEVKVHLRCWPHGIISRNEITHIGCIYARALYMESQILMDFGKFSVTLMATSLFVCQKIKVHSNGNCLYIYVATTTEARHEICLMLINNCEHPIICQRNIWWILRNVIRAIISRFWKF